MFSSSFFAAFSMSASRILNFFSSSAVCAFICVSRAEILSYNSLMLMPPSSFNSLSCWLGCTTLMPPTSLASIFFSSLHILSCNSLVPVSVCSLIFSYNCSMLIPAASCLGVLVAKSLSASQFVCPMGCLMLVLPSSFASIATIRSLASLFRVGSMLVPPSSWFFIFASRASVSIFIFWYTSSLLMSPSFFIFSMYRALARMTSALSRRLTSPSLSVVSFLFSTFSTLIVCSIIIIEKRRAFCLLVSGVAASLLVSLVAAVSFLVAVAPGSPVPFSAPAPAVLAFFSLVQPVKDLICSSSSKTAGSNQSTRWTAFW
mmetsp:Transcript_16244/g.38655  ORF Transcript_16244/g.38655 Transcript_16244/m.38655 type:complete len:316 (+) Transcript_16244:328-1275(+)